jgi:hypothetical protein
VPSVGSIPLPDAETVFRPLAAATGPHLKRLPDGETGIRKTSIRFLQQVLARNGRSACALALRSSRPSPLNRHSPDSRQLRESRVALLTGLGNANRPPRKAILFLPELEVRIQFPPAKSLQTIGPRQLVQKNGVKRDPDAGGVIAGARTSRRNARDHRPLIE